MRSRCLGVSAGALALAVLASAAHGQEIEARAFTNTPVGVNFLIGGYAFTRGALSFDPALPITDARFETSSMVLAYARSFDILGMSALFDANVPVTWLSGSALVAGQPVERWVTGLQDARFRLSLNFVGAPALSLEDFRSYRQDLIVGARLQLSVPTGQYDSNRLVNLGTNRWFVRPELGMSKAIGPVTLEASAAATFFTDNTNAFGGATRSQQPIYSIQGHAIYNFGAGPWVSLDVLYFTGGRTAVNGVGKDDLLRTWRLGVSLSVPVSARYSIRFFASRGVSARTGNDYGLVGLAVQYRWGGGV